MQETYRLEAITQKKINITTKIEKKNIVIVDHKQILTLGVSLSFQGKTAQICLFKAQLTRPITTYHLPRGSSSAQLDY